MIQELLSYSRLTLMAMKAQPVRVARVVKDGLAQLTWEIEQCKATVNVTESNHVILGNYAILVQVIVNLVANALKFIDPSKTADVAIYDEEREDFLRVWVVDNGIGIAAEHQDRIFRIFERLHGRDSFTGTGIGLAIVHKAISRLNGRVGVESEVGKGSRFWFELPIHRPSDGEESLVESGELEAV